MKSTAFPFSETLRSFLTLKQFFFRNRWPLAIGFISLLLVDFLQLVIPLVIKRAINLLTAGNATSQALFQLGTVILGIAVAMAVFRFVWRHLILGHARKVEEYLRNLMYTHIQTLSLSFYHRTKTGNLMARAVNDINAVRMATGMGLVALVDGLILGTAAIGFMLSINAKLTLIAILPTPVIIGFSKVLSRKMSSGFETAQKTFADLTECVREAFAGIRVIKAYNRKSWANKKIEDEGQRYISANMRLARTLALFFPMMVVFTNVSLAIVIWLGGRLTILDIITTGDFVAFTIYLNLLTWPMMAMGWVTNLFQRGSAAMRRINRILEEVPEIADSARARHISTFRGNIEIKDLNLKYPDQTNYALQNLNFHMQAGETIALVGRVGSGKTTLLNVIPRLLDPPSGSVYVSSRDVRLIPLKTLRENIGFVTQDVFIFSDSIRNNVLLGRSRITPEKLEEALRISDIYDDIKALDKGLDTILGERGITLSGGQRQRLTIARSLIQEPSILILDDALSMVDTRTEERILNQILKIRQKKSTLIVSHRVSTISRADRICVLEQGKLVEEGSHAGLLSLDGIYATLYKRQIMAQRLEMGGNGHA